MIYLPMLQVIWADMMIELPDIETIFDFVTTMTVNCLHNCDQLVLFLCQIYIGLTPGHRIAPANFYGFWALRLYVLTSDDITSDYCDVCWV